MLHDSPLLKKTCVRQVALDKWFPLNPGHDYHCDNAGLRLEAGGGRPDDVDLGYEHVTGIISSISSTIINDINTVVLLCVLSLITLIASDTNIRRHS